MWRLALCRGRSRSEVGKAAAFEGRNSRRRPLSKLLGWSPPAGAGQERKACLAPRRSGAAHGCRVTGLLPSARSPASRGQEPRIDLPLDEARFALGWLRKKPRTSCKMRSNARLCPGNPQRHWNDSCNSHSNFCVFCRGFKRKTEVPEIFVAASPCKHCIRRFHGY
jgi:hypothetical protein